MTNNHALARAEALPIATHHGQPADLLTPAEREAVEAYLIPDLAPATMRRYAGALGIFRAYCAERGASFLPADAQIVASYLVHLAEGNRTLSTINAHRSAMKQAHTYAGYDSPTEHPAVRQVMKNIRRKHGKPAEQHAAITKDILVRMLGAIDTRQQTAIRDRALLLLCFAGAFRRSEVLSLTPRHIRFIANRGMEVTLTRSKTNQHGNAEVIVIPYGQIATFCAVRAVECLLRQQQPAEDTAIFQGVTRAGKPRGRALSAEAMRQIVKAYAAAAGVDPRQVSPHSLRAGFVTSAAELGAAEDVVMRHSRHKSAIVYRGYVRRADRWKDTAAGKVM